MQRPIGSQGSALLLGDQQLGVDEPCHEQAFESLQVQVFEILVFLSMKFV